MLRFFRYEDALWPNLLAMSYVLSGYIAGLLLLLSPVLALNFIGVLIFSHSMVIAAYLLHECAHNSIFRKNKYHRWMGEVLLWICGSSYSNYDDVRHKHVRHHTDKGDVVSFDYRKKIKDHPVILKIILTLEWLYIPAVEFMMHLLVVILPFIKSERKNRRFRIIIMLILRGGFFICLAQISLKILIFYPLSYMIFLVVMRFMDVHQHTYVLFETLYSPRGLEAKQFDREFEFKNTYSNLLSEKHPCINLLVLNFSYHNAHHQQPGRPWYYLPELHKEIYGDKRDQVLSIKALLKSYSRHRKSRVLNEDPVNMSVKHDEEGFIGVDGVSFLTAH